MAGMSDRLATMFRLPYRLARLVLHFLLGAAILVLVFPWIKNTQRKATIVHWSAGLLRIVAVRLHIHGHRAIGAAPVLLVANHVSWIDIFVILAALPVRFVSKSEVRAWPLIGWMIARTGTLFLKRATRRDAARINGQVIDALAEGDTVAVFPEGTTSDGSTVLPFHGSLLQPAVEAGANVLPLALQFRRPDGSLCREAAYDGDRSLWQTSREMLALAYVDVHLWFLPPLSGATLGRRELAAAAREAIRSRLLPEPRSSHSRTADGPRDAVP